MRDSCKQLYWRTIKLTHLKRSVTWTGSNKQAEMTGMVENSLISTNRSGRVKDNPLFGHQCYNTMTDVVVLAWNLYIKLIWLVKNGFTSISVVTHKRLFFLSGIKSIS